MQVYVALLRGINVGGKTLIKMAELKAHMEAAGLEHVKPYIQSGNIIFASDRSALELSQVIKTLISEEFNLNVPMLVVSLSEYEKIIKSVPTGWGEDPGWKYNVLFLLPPTNSKEAVASIGELKPDIESVIAGKGVVYQSINFKAFGRARSGKLASMPIYQQVTVRNHRTGYKILDLMKECAALTK